MTATENPPVLSAVMCGASHPLDEGLLCGHLIHHHGPHGSGHTADGGESWCDPELNEETR